MTEFGRWLSDPLVLVGLCAIFGGGILCAVAWAFTGEYERGGYESVHRRPDPKKAEPWMVDSGGQPIVHRPRHQFAGTPDERTRNLMPYVAASRARVVYLKALEEEENAEVEKREAARWSHHPGTSSRVRIAEEEDEQEEGREDRERGEDEGRPEGYGEESRAYPQEAPQVATARERWFRNAVTGEYIFLDEYGRRVDFRS